MFITNNSKSSNKKHMMEEISIHEEEWKRECYLLRYSTPDLKNEVMFIFFPLAPPCRSFPLLEMGKHLLYSHFNTHLLNFTPLNSWENSNCYYSHNSSNFT